MSRDCMCEWLQVIHKSQADSDWTASTQRAILAPHQLLFLNVQVKKNCNKF